LSHEKDLSIPEKDLFGNEKDVSGSAAKFILDWWCNRFERQMKKKYNVSAKKEINLLKTLVKNHGFDSVMACADQFFLDENNSLSERSGKTIGVFWSTFNSYPKLPHELRSKARTKGVTTDDLRERLAESTRLSENGSRTVN